MERVKQPVDIESIFTSIPGCHLILLPDAPTFTIVGATDAYLAATYCKREEVIGLGVFQALTDNAQNPQATGVKNLKASLCQVLEHKMEHRMADQRYDVYNPVTNEFELRVWRPINKPVLGDNGHVQYIIHTVEDITANVMLQEQSQATGEKLKESESLFRNMVEQAPVAILLSRGEEVVIESINAPMLKLLNKSSFEDLLGKEMLEVFPELKGQQALQTVINVQRTGIPYKGVDQPIELFINEKLERHYFNLSYTPVIESGEITGVLHIAVDVTKQVESRKKIEESAEELQLAIGIADLGTFRLDLRTNKATNSKKVDEWFGYEVQGYSREEGFNPIHPEDRNQVDQAILNSLQSEAVSRHDVAYRVVHPRTGIVRHLRSMGKALFDEGGKPYLIIGIIQDITQQILYQKQLEESEAELHKRVLERTLELEMRNRELEQFTHVSHHDLQEPLRKIMMFTEMVKAEAQEKLSEASQMRLKKVSDSALRMSTALRDVLDFASLSKAEQLVEVDLDEVLGQVQNDLELVISEKKVLITSDALPTITAVPAQMHQLLYNLVNNALKFSKPEISPRIRITATQLNGSEVAQHEGLDQSKTYHFISVQDNGIGFNQGSAQRIFDMFHRLHSKEAFGGTGIGLALCKKVVANHSGKIWADSIEGEGATFNILLPAD